ncbi:hypothetical protein ACEWY4_001247 [Coilia grayii]|uniref:Endonuclease/exonuclease/phosphatase domain-containing protein n=1 Tax=Coilia grayii TaxID=363190 RepID=A0ABD1KYY0_9TELE
MSPNIVLMGDFNIHLDNYSSIYVKDFLGILDCMDITQYVDFPTHNKEHTLDLVCSSGITPSNFSTAELPISDHKLVLFDTYLPTIKCKTQRVMSYRNLKKIKAEELSSVIASYPCPDTSLEDLVDYYNNCMSTALNILAPLKARTVSFIQSSPWFTPELRQMKSKGRRLERLSKKTGLVVHKEMYAEHILQYKNSISAAKTSYYAKTIREGGRNTRTLFSIVNGLLKPPDNTMHQLLKSPVTTPNNDIPNDHCSAFLNFFYSKIANIHEQLASANIMQPELVAAITTTLTSSGALHGFSFPTEEYISELITKSNSSTCLLDPIPTSLVKVCLPVIITPITSIIKSSLTTGTVP